MKTEDPKSRDSQDSAENRRRMKESLEDQMPVARNLTPFQKRVEAIETVILCVAEVEKMVRDMGKSMVDIAKSHAKTSLYHFPKGQNLSQIRGYPE